MTGALQYAGSAACVQHTQQAKSHTFLSAGSPHPQLGHCSGNAGSWHGKRCEAMPKTVRSMKVLEKNADWGEFAGVIRPVPFPFPSFFKWRLIEMICLLPLSTRCPSARCWDWPQLRKSAD